MFIGVQLLRYLVLTERFVMTEAIFNAIVYATTIIEIGFALLFLRLRIRHARD